MRDPRTRPARARPAPADPSRASSVRGLGALLAAWPTRWRRCGDQLYTSGNLVIASPDNPVTLAA